MRCRVSLTCRHSQSLNDFPFSLLMKWRESQNFLYKLTHTLTAFSVFPSLLHLLSLHTLFLLPSILFIWAGAAMVIKITISRLPGNPGMDMQSQLLAVISRMKDPLFFLPQFQISFTNLGTKGKSHLHEFYSHQTFWHIIDSLTEEVIHPHIKITVLRDVPGPWSRSAS